MCYWPCFWSEQRTSLICTLPTSSSWLKDMEIHLISWHWLQRIMTSFQRRRVFIGDLRLSESRCQLDEVEQASVKLIKDWSHEVCKKHAPASSICVGTDSRRVDPVTSLSLRTWYLHQRQSVHYDKRTPVFHARRTLPRRSPAYTGFVRLNVTSSSWRRWLIVVYTAQPPATCPLN